jgi:hypothetical protein
MQGLRNIPRISIECTYNPEVVMRFHQCPSMILIALGRYLSEKPIEVAFRGSLSGSIIYRLYAKCKMQNSEQ